MKRQRSAQFILDGMTPDEREKTLRAVDLRRRVIITMSETAGHYGRLVPNGRTLVHEERVATLERLEAGARCLRTVDREWEIIELLTLVEEETGETTDLRPALSVLRTMQRSLILALSGDSERRKRAKPVSDLAPLVRSVIALLPD